MIPKRRNQKQTTPKETNNRITQSSKTNSNQQTGALSIVELLQNQIEEERKNARKRSNQVAQRQPINAMPPRQLLQKKKQSTTNNSNINLSDNLYELPKPNIENRDMKTVKVDTETLPVASEVKQPMTEPKKEVQHAEMTSMAVGDDQEITKKLEPTGFTYFDRLNEKSIFLDPCDYI